MSVTIEHCIYGLGWRPIGVHSNVVSRIWQRLRLLLRYQGGIKAITRLYKHIIIDNKVYDEHCVNLYKDTIYRFLEVTFSGHQLGMRGCLASSLRMTYSLPMGGKQGLPIAFWIHIALIWTKDSFWSESLCCVCVQWEHTPVFSPVLSFGCLYGPTRNRQVISNLIMVYSVHTHKWLPNKAKWGMVYHE